LLQQADKEEPQPTPRQGGAGKKPRGKPKKTKGRNLFDRLAKHQEAVLAFAFHEDVPFTNNQAEGTSDPPKPK
jgi:transposase